MSYKRFKELKVTIPDKEGYSNNEIENLNKVLKLSKKIKYTYSPKYSKINRDLEIGDIILIEDFLREYPIFRQANNEWRCINNHKYDRNYRSNLENYLSYYDKKVFIKSVKKDKTPTKRELITQIQLYIKHKFDMIIKQILKNITGITLTKKKYNEIVNIFNKTYIKFMSNGITGFPYMIRKNIKYYTLDIDNHTPIISPRMSLVTDIISKYITICYNENILFQPCPICFEEFLENNKKYVYITKCGHIFCKQCLNGVDKCPLCRSPIILR